MPLGQPDFLGGMLQRHLLGHQQDGMGAFDQPDGHGGGAYPLSELVFFRVAQFHDQGGFSTAHSYLKEFRQSREIPEYSSKRGIPTPFCLEIILASLRLCVRHFSGFESDVKNS
jgi:hypothetical protein